MTVVVDQLGLWPGQRIGGYEVVGEIGGGGIGMVYRAIHVLLGRSAAIKVLRPEYCHVGTVVERFFTEAQLTTSIRHPGIVEIFDYGHTDDGRAYIVMELLAGDSLAHRLARTGRMPTAMAAVIARRIAGALSAAHDRGVVHRDLKPDNIHLVRDPDGGAIDQIKLLDFGIAKRVESRSSTQRTTTGVLIGTPVYMAPEQCRGAADTDHRVDLYALGCVLFEMVLGRPPFVARSAGELLAAHIHAPAPDLRDHAASVPPGLAKLVARLLAKDPAARPATAEQVVRELDELLVALAAPSRPRRALTVVASATGFLAIAASLVLSRGRRATAPGHAPGPDAVVARPAPLASLPPTPAAELDAAVTGVWSPRPAPPAPAPTVLPPDPVATSAPTVPIRIRPPRSRATTAARDQDGVTFELGDGSADDAIDTVVRDP